MGPFSFCLSIPPIFSKSAKGHIVLSCIFTNSEYIMNIVDMITAFTKPRRRFFCAKAKPIRVDKMKTTLLRVVFICHVNRRRAEGSGHSPLGWQRS